MRHRNTRNTTIDSQSSDALADIALNSLGLILIVMLVYILLFRETTQKVVHAAQAQTAELEGLRDVETENTKLRDDLEACSPENTEALLLENGVLAQKLTAADKLIARQVEQAKETSIAIQTLNSTNEDLRQTLSRSELQVNQFSGEIALLQKTSVDLKNEISSTERRFSETKESEQRLQSQITTLEHRLVQRTSESQSSGLWRFRNSVTELVDHNDKSESVDWTIDYFLYMNVVDGKVTGALFGAHEIKTDKTHGNSQSYGTISGSLSPSGILDVELTFLQGSSNAGSEHLRCNLDGDTFIGRLESGKHQSGYRNYVGPTTGTRLTESVFQ